MLVVIVVVIVVALAGILSYGYFYANWFGNHTSCPSNSLTTGFSGTQTITGAGSSFVFPLMTAWSSAVSANSSSCLQVTYNSVGSGAGIAQLTSKIIDFGASDAPMTYLQVNGLPGPALTFPEAIGSVTVEYNINNLGVPSGLHLSGGVVGKIFTGNITYWDDPAITANNTGVTLPHLHITVVVRSDASGTTYQFSHYLASQDPYFASTVGTGTQVNWPMGLTTASKGSGGVTQTVQTTNGAIGYAEQNYAATASPKVSYAAIQNSANTWVWPSPANASLAAADVAPTLPPGSGNWTPVTLLNQPGTDTYPISTFTFIMVYHDLGIYGGSLSKDQAQALVNFLAWIVTTGQQFNEPLYFAPLPSAVVTQCQTTIGELQYNGAALQTP